MQKNRYDGLVKVLIPREEDPDSYLVRMFEKGKATAVKGVESTMYITDDYNYIVEPTPEALQAIVDAYVARRREPPEDIAIPRLVANLEDVITWFINNDKVAEAPYDLRCQMIVS
mgnify:CR=1 FL=1